MFRCIFGKTGGGKTMTLTKKLVDTLLYTERFCIVTMQELEIPRLNEYLQERIQAEGKRCNKTVMLSERLLIIPKKDTRCFYRYRSGGLVLPEYDELDAKGKKKPLPQFNEEIEAYWQPLYDNPAYGKGVEYFLTEVHRFFPAREYQAFERTMGFYSTQHRHFDDNVWLETQFPGQIDLNFRELVREWYFTRNNYLESFGMFKKRGCFIWKLYYDLPKGKVAADDEGTFSLDAKGLASCYRTRGAVSALASGPEEAPKSRKLPFWMFPVALALLCLAVGAVIMAVPKMASKGVSAVLGGVSHGVQKGLGPMVPAVPAPGGGGSGGGGSTSSQAFYTSQKVVEPTTEVRVTSVLRVGRSVQVRLSNGEVFTDEDSELSEINGRYVVIGGRRYRYVVGVSPSRPVSSGGAFGQVAPQSGAPVVSGSADVSSKSPSGGFDDGSWTYVDGVHRLKAPDSLETMAKH